MKVLSDMTPGEINRELDRLDTARDKVNDELIAAGRGYETAEETQRLSRTGDPLALKWRRIADRQADLRAEISRRCGPGAPSRCPKGVRGYRG